MRLLLPVNNPKYTMEDIAEIAANSKLTIGTLAVSAVYKSEKIPYAYDYADVDTNVSRRRFPWDARRGYCWRKQRRRGSGGRSGYTVFDYEGVRRQRGGRI